VCFSAGLRPAPAEATAGATATAHIPWGGAAVSECGDAVNPSMGAWPRHPCRGHPALRHRPTSDRFPRSDGSTPCVDESSSSSNISTVDGRASTHGVDLPCRPRSTPTNSTGTLSKAGWVRLRECPRHECRGQAPKGEGALLAKHCFASARTHSRQRLGRTAERGLRRLPQPDPPRLPTGTSFCCCCCCCSSS